MVENIDRFLDRDEKLSIIALKSSNLNVGTRNINYMAYKIKKKDKMKQMKMMLFIGVGACLLFLFLIIIVQ
jgi:hypothetical protein